MNALQTPTASAVLLQSIYTARFVECCTIIFTDSRTRNLSHLMLILCTLLGIPFAGEMRQSQTVQPWQIQQRLVATEQSCRSIFQFLERLGHFLQALGHNHLNSCCCYSLSQCAEMLVLPGHLKVKIIFIISSSHLHHNLW